MKHTSEKRKLGGIRKLLHMTSLTPLAGFGVAGLLILPFVPPFNKEYLIRWLIVATWTAAQSVAFDFSAGYINIVNFGFAAFVGSGGYTSVLLSVHFGLTPWIGMFIGAFSAAILGFLTGILTLRLRGIFAAVMAWFIGLALMGLAIQWTSLTRGPRGIRCPNLFETSSNVPYYYVILSMLLVTLFVLGWVTRSHAGLAFRAIGQNMDAARTSGINPTRYRILNFTLSCAFAGWLGGFYAHYYGIMTPAVMDTSKTVEVLAVTFIGGRGSLWGGAFTAFPFVYATEVIRSSLSDLPGLNLLLYGVFLVMIMIFYSGGVAQLYRSFITRSENRVISLLVSKDTAQN